jgi:hypothetical protein
MRREAAVAIASRYMALIFDGSDSRAVRGLEDRGSRVLRITCGVMLILFLRYRDFMVVEGAMAQSSV